VEQGLLEWSLSSVYDAGARLRLDHVSDADCHFPCVQQVMTPEFAAATRPLLLQEFNKKFILRAARLLFPRTLQIIHVFYTTSNGSVGRLSCCLILAPFMRSVWIFLYHPCSLTSVVEVLLGYFLQFLTF
jgi:hypothetical protein